jgi:hypothetical protein
VTRKEVLPQGFALRHRGLDAGELFIAARQVIDLPDESG